MPGPETIKGNPHATLTGIDFPPISGEVVGDNFIGHFLHSPIVRGKDDIGIFDEFMSRASGDPGYPPGNGSAAPHNDQTFPPWHSSMGFFCPSKGPTAWVFGEIYAQLLTIFSQ